MIKNRVHKILSIVLAAAMTASLTLGSLASVSAADSPPMKGDQARKPNQPKFSGYRTWDIRDWTPETDPYSEFMQAKIPLQERITPFKPTQANPTLDSDAEIMLMQGDYGNAFVDGMMYNNTFSYLTLNFWQYADYFSPWHGAAGASTPEDLHDWEFEASDPNGWQKRYFEFGTVNIPNPAYTNAAHRNGVKSIACIYFDQSFRVGQTINELFVQDADGKFPVAEKLIEMAHYFGYDGYFFNAEETVESRFAVPKQKFLARLEEAGLYTQYYNQTSAMNASKAEWLETEIDGVKTKLQDSVFVNYGWPGSFNSQLKFIEDNNYDPFGQVFYGIECNDKSFGHATLPAITEMYAPGTKNPRASIALFTPSDFYQRSLPDGLPGMGGLNSALINDPDYQWMIAERERMFFSGMLQDPTQTGRQENFSAPEIGLNKKQGSIWVGAADFTSERSVINGSTFYSTFNTGKGMQYFSDGAVSSDDQWSNINIQSILPTWQWWMSVPAKTTLSARSAEDTLLNDEQPVANEDTLPPVAPETPDAETATPPALAVAPRAEVNAATPQFAKLDVDFDYGDKYFTNATQFDRVGGYDGGSSLVVAGNLETENTLRLFKTDLDVTADSNMEITYFKPSKTDGSEMKLALILQDDPDTIEYISIPSTGTKTSKWTTATVNLGSYADQKIATIGLAFSPKQGTVANYQMNIGEIRLTDGQDYAPKTPTGFRIDRMFTDDELIAKWDLESFDTVDNYELTALLSNGQRLFTGGIYDDIFYIKNLLKEKSAVSLELVAVGKDGSRSEPAVVSFDFTDKVSNVKVAEETKEIITRPTAEVKGSMKQNNELATLNLTWANPKTDYKNLKIEVSFIDSTDPATFVQTVDKGATSAAVIVPRGKGEHYKAAISTVLSDGTVTEPIVVTGKMKDVYVEPYNADMVVIKGTGLSMWCPDAKDWLKMHVTANGQQLSFASYRWGWSEPMALRAGTTLKSTLPAKDGVLSIVLEDYAGNFSEPTVIHYYANPDAEITSTMVPDATLFEAIKAQAGTTIKQVTEYTGTINLSGLDIANFKGLDLLVSAAAIDLSGSNLTTISKGMLSGNAEKLILKNSTALTKIDFDALKGMSKLKELDITGCTQLQILNINDTSLEKLTYGNATDFTKLVSVNMSGAKFDMSAGTPERAFADAIAAQTVGVSDIIDKASDKTNLAKGKTPDAASTITNAAKLFDGIITYFTPSPKQGNVILKFDSPQEIVGWKLFNDTSSGYGFADFEVQYSVDGTTWNALGTPVVGNTAKTVEQTITNPVPAKYYKLTTTKAMTGNKADVCEFELYGYETVAYIAGVNFSNQKPAAYQAELPKDIKLALGQGTVNAAYLRAAVTARGTDFAGLKDADFIDPTYDLNAQAVDAGLFVKLTDSKGNVTANNINTEKSETYRAEFISFNDAGLEGKLLGTTTVTVGEGGIIAPIVPPTITSRPSSSSPVKETTDEKSGVSIEIADGVTNVSNPSLTASELPDWSMTSKDFVKAAKGYFLEKVFLIDLFSGTSRVTQVEGGKIKVDIPFSGDAAKQYVVLRYNDDGTITELKATYANGKISFETDHFSAYAIAVKDGTASPAVPDPVSPSVPTSVPKTGDALLDRLF